MSNIPQVIYNQIRETPLENITKCFYTESNLYKPYSICDVSIPIHIAFTIQSNINNIMVPIHNDIRQHVKSN